MEEDITICDINVAANQCISKHQLQVWLYHGPRDQRERQAVALVGILKKKASEEKVGEDICPERTPRPVNMKISYRDNWGSEKRPHFLLKGLG